jgi:hypothetical protein
MNTSAEQPLLAWVAVTVTVFEQLVEQLRVTDPAPVLVGHHEMVPVAPFGLAVNKVWV